MTSLARMPVDMFPAMNIPVVVVATFYSGMPPEQIETDITSRFERFFTLGSGIEHIESRSLPGVSVIKVYFQPGTNPDSAVTTISNLAMAQLRRLPPGTLPPVVLKFDASSLPVCLVTFKGEGLNETSLRDLAQFQVRNQIASVPGASVPQPFGGRYRQIMVYADPYKLEAHQLSLMDVVRSVNNANLILPAGDVQLGLLDYNIYTNSQLRTVGEINQLPVKTVGQDAGPRFGYRLRRRRAADPDQPGARGRPAFGLPAGSEAGRRHQHHRGGGRHQGTRSSTCSTCPRAWSAGGLRSIRLRQNGDRNPAARRRDRTVPDFHDDPGLSGNMRATVAVFFSIPLSALAAFIALSLGGGSINSMVLGRAGAGLFPADR